MAETLISIASIVVMILAIWFFYSNQKFILAKLVGGEAFRERILDAVMSSGRLWEHIENTYRHKVGEDEDGNLDEFEMLVLFVFDSASDYVHSLTGFRLPKEMLNTVRDIVHAIITELEEMEDGDTRPESD